jgi:hypothetical protein
MLVKCLYFDVCFGQYVHINSFVCFKIIAVSIICILGYSTNMCILNQSLISFNYTTNVSQPYSLYSFHIKAITTSITITCSLTDWYAFYGYLKIYHWLKWKTSEQLIGNEDFQTDSSTNWNYGNPNSTSNSSGFGQNGSFASQCDHYFYFGAPHSFSESKNIDYHRKCL